VFLRAERERERKKRGNKNMGNGRGKEKRGGSWFGPSPVQCCVRAA